MNTCLKLVAVSLRRLGALIGALPLVWAALSSPASAAVTISQVYGGGGSVDILSDLTDSIPMSATAGKVALTCGTTALTDNSPVTVAVADLVAYGSTANIFEDSCAGAAGTSVTPIYAIQGAGAVTPPALANQVVTTSGVVTKLISSGFFIQDLTGDGNPLTSDGIFVFVNPASCPNAQVGHLVRVTGTVTEYLPGSGTGTASMPLTELTTITSVVLVGTGYTVTPTVVTLPLAQGESFERYEGMLVTIISPMTVQQNFFQGRYGQITLGANGRHETPTNRFRPGANAQALADQQARSRLLLDDSSSGQNPNPIPYLAAASGVPRAGDGVSQLTGVIDFGLATSSAWGAGLYRLQPTVAPVFTASNPRPATPPAVGGNVKVASMNVLNYFTTFTNGETVSGQTGQTCMQGETALKSCRGASNVVEFKRQRGKIVLALAGLNADVVGLMEIQNNGAVAVQDLVDALNALVGAGTYAAVPDPAVGTGSDAIKVAMIFKPARLSRFGNAASDTNPVNNRPTLAQTFSAANGERFTVVVNHLKSKGSCPSSGVDLDQGDGQGCWNATRVQQAQRLRSFIATQQIDSGSNDAVVIGDMNAYGQEDPIFELTSNGYIDQLLRFNTLAYSYIFDGTSGRLDHGITTASLSPKVAGAKHWQINADEASVRDYNQEFKFPATTCRPEPCPADPFDAGTAARSSDHDPVLIGLNIYKDLTGSSGADVINGTAGDDRITGGPGADRLTGGAGANLYFYASVLDGGDTITDFKPHADKIVLTDILRSIQRNPDSDLIALGYVTCSAVRGGALIGIDTDGHAGPLPPRSLALLQSQKCATVMNAQNFVF